VASKSYKHSQNNNERNKQMKTVMQSMYSAIGVAFACFALLPKLQAVVPAPDGGYPGGNTAEGQNALFSLTTGGFNTAVGYFSLRSDTTASFNTGVGAGTLFANTADNNTATGAAALLSNTSGANNTANGALALFRNTTGFFNTAIGTAALQNNTTGAANTALGVGAGANVTTANNVICIGAQGANVSNGCYIAQIRGVTTGNPDAIPVLIDSAGQLGTASSSRRYKKEIEPMDNASEVILALKPVTFHYKSDKTNRPEFGLIAEEVAEVNPDLVVRDKNGEIYTVRYDAVNAMLLNEFLKEHRKVEELQATVVQHQKRFAQQQNQIEALASGLQKVSAELEMTKAATQIAANNQ
jgi:Chaperone of endosialidase